MSYMQPVEAGLGCIRDGRRGRGHLPVTGLGWGRPPLAARVGQFFSTSEIYVRTFGGDLHELEFRGVEKAKYAHDLILFYIIK